ncbi:MAG: hypothetical protein KGH66_03245, partial [Candidatus Micrarchaeota archaeon]|nr:hypothetical protein [Candidatus Micrarchaeota archaeon]
GSRINKEVRERVVDKWLESNHVGKTAARDISFYSRLLSSDRACGLYGEYRKEVADEILAALWPSHTYGGPLLKRDASGAEHAIRVLASKEVVAEVAKASERLGPGGLQETIRPIVGLAAVFGDREMMAGSLRVINLSGTRMFNLLDFGHDNSMIYMTSKGMHNLANDRDSAMALIAYVISIKNECFRRGNFTGKPWTKLPEPNEQNIGNYRDIVAGYVAERYGLDNVKEWQSIIRILPMEVYKVKKLAPLMDAFGIDTALGLELDYKFSSMPQEAVSVLTGLILKAKERNPREYAINQGKNNPGTVEELRYTRQELLEYSVIAILGSRSPDREGRAVRAISSIVGMQAVNRARSEFQGGYKRLINEIVNAMSRSDPAEAHRILASTGAEAIRDVLNAANYKDVRISSANFVKAVESKNPLDYNGGVQIACVYLPNYTESGIRGYCENENVVLVRYDIGDKAVGSAICLRQGDLFLVDSVEGHRTFRKDSIFDIVFEDLVKRASEYGAKTVLFHKDSPNETPRMFIEYLGKRGLQDSNVEVKLNTGSAYIEARMGSSCYTVTLR